MSTLIRGVAALALFTLTLIVGTSTSATAGAVVTKIVTQPFAINTCVADGGEQINGEGTLTLVMIPQGQSGRFLIKSTEHATGVGFSSGAKYELNFHVEILNDGPVFSITNRAQLVSQGTTPNRTLLFTFGVDKDGNAFFIFKDTCTG